MNKKLILTFLSSLLCLATFAQQALWGGDRTNYR